MRILIAEDSKTDQEVLQGLLKKQGECVVADTAQEAYELFTSALDEGNPFKLVCLDIVLPDEDGKSTLARLRKYEKDKGVEKKNASVIIMTTGQSDMKNVLKATDAGCNGYVTKPIFQERLFIELSKFGLVQEWTEGAHPPV